VDSAYAGRTVLEDRPPNVHVISRLRWDAALYAVGGHEILPVGGHEPAR
jgi:hypothetical protein